MNIVEIAGVTITGPLPIMPFDQYLDFHIQALAGIVGELVGDQDIVPTFWYVDRSGSHKALLPPYKDKDTEVAMYREVMRREGAVQYAIVSSAWQAEFTGPDARRLMNLYEREGWIAELLPYRKEVAHIIAGDKDHSVLVAYEMIRANDRVTLKRIPDLPATANVIGRMADLLKPPGTIH